MLPDAEVSLRLDADEHTTRNPLPGVRGYNGLSSLSCRSTMTTTTAATVTTIMTMMTMTVMTTTAVTILTVLAAPRLSKLGSNTRVAGCRLSDGELAVLRPPASLLHGEPSPPTMSRRDQHPH